ncbi:MAG: T9SS type A sorting domain-containing protein [Bacteroidota bacterium]
MRLVKYIKPLFLQRSMLVTLIAALWLFSSLEVNAQELGGWEKIFGQQGLDQNARSIIQTRDHGYILVGEVNEGNNTSIYAARTDVDGTIIWEKNIKRVVASTPVFLSAADVLETDDGGFVIAGTTAGQGSSRDFYLAQYDMEGNLMWEQFYGGGSEEEASAVTKTSDGGYLIVGTLTDGAGGNNLEIMMVKTDADGNEQFSITPIQLPGSDEEANSVIELSTGGFVIVGSTNDGGSQGEQVFIVKVASNGFWEWNRSFGGSKRDKALDVVEDLNGDIITIGTFTGDNSDVYFIKLTPDGFDIVSKIFEDPIVEVPNAAVLAEDGTVVVAGYRETDPITSKAVLTKYSVDGDVIWTEEVGRFDYLNIGEDVFLDSEGNYVIGGTSTGPISDLQLSPNVLLIKTNSMGVVTTNYIEGLVYHDKDNGCDLDTDEDGLKGWRVAALNTDLNKTYYGTTDEQGHYAIRVPEGTYNLRTVGPNQYWASCTESFNINLAAEYDTIQRNFGINEAFVCPNLEIDASTPFLEACEESVYTINYCNNGTAEAENSEAQIVLDDDLQFLSSEPISPKTVNDSLYTFDLGDLAPGDCGQFRVTVAADCGAVLQQAHCLIASITPNEICLEPDPEWDESSLDINAFCDGDSVRFFIENRGSRPTEASKNWIVIEDHVMFRQGTVPAQLSPNANQALTLEANGSTYRLSVNQSQGHPGNSNPTMAVEGCSPTGSYMVGYLNQFEEDDRNHFRSVDCQENLDISTYGPYFKRGYPKGYGDDAEIEPETDLKYIINFQNVGTDTAIRVVIRDTLSPFLDPASVRLGAGSHDYELEVYDGGILKFTFENIQLPASSTNEEASYGFVKYRVSQKPDNADGSRIKNGAAVYFDYHAPGTTELVCHTVRDSIGLLVSVGEIFAPQVSDIKVFPNPFTRVATMEVISKQTFQQLDLSIFDAQGRLIRRESYNSMRFELQRGNLASGLYVYKLEADGLLISSGKFLAQ